VVAKSVTDREVFDNSKTNLVLIDEEEK